MRIYRVGLSFTLDGELLVPLHYALQHLRAIEVAAPNGEIAEAHVDQLRLALEAQADIRR